MQSDARLPTRITLPDGAAIDVRELHESDEPGLRVWFGSLSENSRFQRFHSPVADLSDVAWRYLTRIDGEHHVAIVAFHDGKLVGVARMIELDSVERTAEVAFLIDDRYQHRGVGSGLRDILLALAHAKAYRRLYAYVLHDNRMIRRLLAGATTADHGDVLELAPVP